MTTAYLSLLLVILHYVLGGTQDGLLNRIDRGFLGKIPIRKWCKPNKRFVLTIRRAVLIFSDQQAVTGIALLASGYIQLSQGIITYDWRMIVRLSWYSSLTHLTTLTMLRQHFRNNRGARIGRAIIMSVMAILLVLALLPSGDALSSPAEPALCAFNRLMARDPQNRYEFEPLYNGPAMIISITILFSGYLTRFVRLSESGSNSVRKWIRIKPGHVFTTARTTTLQQADKTSLHLWYLVCTLSYILIEVSYVVLRAIADISESLLWEVCDRFRRTHSLPSTISNMQILISDDAGNVAHICLGLGYLGFRHGPHSSRLFKERLEFWPNIPTPFVDPPTAQYHRNLSW